MENEVDEVFLGPRNSMTWKFPVPTVTISYSFLLPLSSSTLRLSPLQCLKHKYQKVALPHKYALELLTIYAWEMGTDESENFNLDEGFVAVMELLRDYDKICILWTKYYDFQNEIVRNVIKQPLKEPR